MEGTDIAGPSSLIVAKGPTCEIWTGVDWRGGGNDGIGAIPVGNVTRCLSANLINYFIDYFISIN